MEIRLDKKVALITGATSGIGRATAHRFPKWGGGLCLPAIFRTQQKHPSSKTDGRAGGNRRSDSFPCLGPGGLNYRRHVQHRRRKKPDLCPVNRFTPKIVAVELKYDIVCYSYEGMSPLSSQGQESISETGQTKNKW